MRLARGATFISIYGEESIPEERGEFVLSGETRLPREGEVYLAPDGFAQYCHGDHPYGHKGYPILERVAARLPFGFLLVGGRS